MTTDFRALPTQERLRELFRYEPKEGALYWIKRHNSQIDLSKPAGWRQQNGYHGMTVDGVRYKRHRIVWCYFNGDPGGFEIDHINGVKADVAQPEPEGPSDKELDLVVIAIQALIPPQPDATTHHLSAVDRGREILRQRLARWGNL
jgi:hypothetical protein